MSLTVTACVAELVGRASDLMALVGLSVAPDSTNADAVSALGYGLVRLQVGAAPTSGLAPSDADLAGLTAAQVYGVLDIAEWRLLSTCRNRFTAVRMQVGSGSAYWSDLRDSLDRRLAELFKELKSMGVFGLAPLAGGVITLDITETDATEQAAIDFPGSV